MFLKIIDNPQSTSKWWNMIMIFLICDNQNILLLWIENITAILVLHVFIILVAYALVMCDSQKILRL